MLSHTLLPLLLAAVVVAQPDPDVPRPTPAPNANPTDTANPRLVGKRFPPNAIPFKADTGDGPCGIQVGFNQCNATTESQTSMCQTIWANSIEDFCLFIPPTPMEVGSAEAGMVSTCTKKGHGGRLIPQGALKGVQVLNAPSYQAIVGRIDQSMLNIPDGDAGGELDSGGQDQRGNPLGALAYSTARGNPEQVVVWHLFLGNNIFCYKQCWNDKPNASNMCEHRYDTFGCGAVIAANYDRLDGVFETCDSDDQIPPRPNTVLPIPATSNCRPIQSAAVYTDGPSVPGGGGSTSGPAPTGSASSSTTPRPGGPGPSTTSTSGGSNPSNTNGPGGSAAKLGGSSIVAFVGLIAGLAGWAVVA